MRSFALVATCAATLLIMILINRIPVAALPLLVGSTLVIILLISFMIFMLALIALLSPNPSYGAKPKTEDPSIINQTLIVLNLPGREPYVLPDKNQPTGKPTAFLPNRRQTHANW